jgi:hypothetical protein
MNRLETSPHAKREVVSGPNAVEIPPSEVCNIEPLTDNDEKFFFRLAGQLPYGTKIAPSGAEFATYDWPDGDVRWGLTPHAVRRVEECERKLRKRMRVF